MRKTTSRLLLSVLIVFPVGAAFGQTYYKCRTASGGTTFSDNPCPGGTRQEQAVSAVPQAQQYGASQNSDARMLDAKVAEAIGTGNIGWAKRLALTPEHWRMIAEAEQRSSQAAIGRSSADLRAEAKNSQECKSAQRHYELQSSSLSRNAASVSAAQNGMYSACGMDAPTVIENRTVINDNRRIASPPPPPQTLRCRQTAGGQMDCW